MEMDEKTKAVICMELDMLKQKVEAGLISRFNFNTDRMFAADGTKMTCTVINCLEEPMVEMSDDRTEGLYENEIPPSVLNKDLSTFRGVSSETICSEKYDLRNLPPFLVSLAADPENTKLLETVLGRGLKGLGHNESGVYFLSKNPEGNPIAETIIAPKEFVEGMRLKGLSDLRETGSRFKATVPLVFGEMGPMVPVDKVPEHKANGEFPIGNTGFFAKRVPSEDKPSLNGVDANPTFPTDLID
jgi:hypothetical protein